MKELIYSNQFPDGGTPDMPPDQILNIFNYISRDVYKELVFVPIPGREEIEKIFYFKAIELSNKYKLDIRIFSAKGATEAQLSFDRLSSFSDLTRFIGMADSISLHSGIFHRKFTLGLTLYTHDIYRSGKRLLPDPEED